MEQCTADCSGKNWDRLKFDFFIKLLNNCFVDLDDKIVLVFPVWVNLRVSDDLGTTIVLHLFLFSLPFSLNCSRALKEFWVGRVGEGILCRHVFLGFFPYEVYNLKYAFELHRTGFVTWYSTETNSRAQCRS